MPPTMQNARTRLRLPSTSLQFFPFCPCDDLHSCNAMSGHFLAYHMIIRDLPEGKFVGWSDERTLVADDHVNASVVRLGCFGHSDDLIVIGLGPPGSW